MPQIETSRWTQRNDPLQPALFRLPRSQHRRLRELANQRGIPVAELVRRLLAESLPSAAGERWHRV